MTELLAALALRTGLPKGAVAAILIALALLIGVGALEGWLALHDRQVVQRHDAKAEVTELRRTIANERAATAADEQQRQSDAAEADQLQQEVTHAVQDHPIDAGRSSGPAVSAALDELRRRQAEERRHPASR